MQSTTTTGLVDFHCHLDLYPDFEALVSECDQLGIFTLAVTTTPRAWQRNHELASKTRHVRSALGLHPQLVGEHAGELPLWEKYLPNTRYVGEVGLDAGPRFRKSLDLQQEVFERVLKVAARAREKILTVHSVKATKLVLDMIEEHLPPPLGGVVLHWFTGTAADARRAVDLGCYFSINAKMLETPRLRDVIAGLPVSRLLTETDGPFIARQRGPIRPADVHLTVAALAALRMTDQAELATRIRHNLKSLLST